MALEGRIDELDGVHAERAELIASLPPVPPRSAEAALRRAAVAQEQTTAALATAARAIGPDRPPRAWPRRRRRLPAGRADAAPRRPTAPEPPRGPRRASRATRRLPALRLKVLAPRADD